MPEEVYVDVRYKSIDIGNRLAVTSVSKNSAFLQSPQPMPVGTSLLLLAGETLEIPVRVSGVSEQVAGLETSPGMTVAPDELAGPALLWWTSLQSQHEEAGDSPDTDVMDVVSPQDVEAAKAEIAAAENAPDAAASDAPESKQEEPKKEEAAAEPKSAEPAAKPAKGKKRKRRRRQTKNR